MKSNIKKHHVGQEVQHRWEMLFFKGESGKSYMTRWHLGRELSRVRKTATELSWGREFQTEQAMQRPWDGSKENAAVGFWECRSWYSMRPRERKRRVWDLFLLGLFIWIYELCICRWKIPKPEGTSELEAGREGKNPEGSTTLAPLLLGLSGRRSLLDENR